MTTKPDLDGPVRRRKLSDDVQERVLALIQNGGLSPGDVLPSERELMARYGVGRPAIREAMQSLQRMGLVTVKHGERPCVAAPSIEAMAGQMALSMRHLLRHCQTTMDHLKEARATFELEMARIAARKRTDADIAALRAILDRQIKARTQPETFLALDGAFHAGIAAISGNPIFESLARSLFDWLAQFHADLVRKRGLEKLTLSEHEAILAAIAAGDPERAAREMADHLYRANSLYHQNNFQPD
jgi:DNA-binding FadR family transcriptional regulator